MKRHQSDTNSSSATSARKINDGVRGRVTGSVEDCHAVDGPPPKTAPRNVRGSRNWSPPATHAPPPPPPPPPEICTGTRISVISSFFSVTKLELFYILYTMCFPTNLPVFNSSLLFMSTPPAYARVSLVVRAARGRNEYSVYSLA